MNYINFFMYLMCNFKYFCKNYCFCIYTVVMGNNKKKKKNGNPITEQSQAIDCLTTGFIVHHAIYITLIPGNKDLCSTE